MSNIIIKDVLGSRTAAANDDARLTFSGKESVLSYSRAKAG